MPENIRSKTRLFADDTIVYLTITSDIDSVSLQDDLNKLAKWEERWKMSFHPEKCNVLTISRKKQPIRNSYTLHGQQLEHVTTAKYLGVSITSDMKWNQHISNICKKANNTMSFLKRNLNIRNANIKEKTYRSLVTPTLEYACTTWDPYLKEDQNRIEMVQRMAARYVVNRYGTTTLHQSLAC
jgi:myo-inositol-hexaphosphate 3-phosphohydrolase